MPADTVLVIDAGTSALRALSLAPGRCEIIASTPWPMFVPEDAGAYGRELPPDGVRLALTNARRDIGAIAVTGQREAVVFADERGDAVLCSPNIDARAALEGGAIDQEHGAALYAVNGHLPSLLLAPAKLRWLRKHRPDDAARVRTIIPFADWIAAVLTGGPQAMTRSLACEIGLADPCGKPHAMLGQLDVDAALLPPVAADGSVAGECTVPEFAGIPVIRAGADTQCALTGCASLEDAETAAICGWSAPVQRVTLAPVFDDQMRTWTGGHAAPGRFVLESNAGDVGRAWDWLRSLMSVSNEEAEMLASRSPVGANDVMVCGGTQPMRASAMTARLGGVTFPLPLAMFEAARGDLLRAQLEATAFALRSNLEQTEEVAGAPAKLVALGGGMSRSALFTRIVASVLGRAVEVCAMPQTTAAGAAASALVATGVESDLAAAARRLTGEPRVQEPDAHASAAYDDLYARWCAMADAFEALP